MRLGTGLLPRSLSDSPISARVWLALAAGAGSSVCAYAGLYPQFDEGSLRLVIALTSAPFAAAVVAYALSVRSAMRAFGTTILVAALLGIASTMIPAAILTRDYPSAFVMAWVYGVFFGAGTGVVYGIPLAILAALGHRHVRRATHDSTDRAARLAGLWLVVLAVVGIIGTSVFDPSTRGLEEEGVIPASPLAALPALVGCAAAITGALAALVATIRIYRRRSWVARVRSGLEPKFRVRAMDERDRIGDLPRLGNGGTVVEVVLEEPLGSAAGSAYRVSATGTAVAIVDDDMCTASSFTVAPAATSASATSG